MSDQRLDQINHMMSLYKQGLKRREILEKTGYPVCAYNDFMRKTVLERAEVYAKRSHSKQAKHIDSVWELAQQGYMVGDIAEALGITLDECRKRYYEERRKHVKLKVRAR